MTTHATHERRVFLQAAAGGLVLAGCATARLAAVPDEGDVEVTPGEDLMQEHGVLERVLLIYDEAVARLEAGRELDLRIVETSAGIVRHFVEDYHERLEEQFIFPRLQAANRETALVATLFVQHQRGRQLTDEILGLVQAKASPALTQALRRFVRMYRPHAAREDTVLFPAFRHVIGRAGYRELGEQFEDREHELFGEDGFGKTVGDIARLEAALGIGDLERFTAP